MTGPEFDAILQARIDKTIAVLRTKAAEYADDTERLHNFKQAVKDFPAITGGGELPEEAIIGMMRKHWVSIADLVSGKVAGRVMSQTAIDEKIGDAVNYLILLEATLLEDYK